MLVDVGTQSRVTMQRREQTARPFISTAPMTARAAEGSKMRVLLYSLLKVLAMIDGCASPLRIH